MSVDLFDPVRCGALTLPNRIVMAPMTRSRGTEDHLATPPMAVYYSARAEGGLLIAEGTAPTANGCGYCFIPGLWSPEQVDSWRPVTQAVHAAGGRIAVQLMHTGRVSHPLNMPEGARVLAPSASTCPGEMFTPQGPRPYPEAEAMDEADIDAALAGLVQACHNAMAAGFDAVELHGANGYLLEQFLCPETNTRADAWGGQIEGRARFTLEAARRCAEAIGAERLGVRLSPFGAFNGIQPWSSATEDFTWLAGKLGELRLAWLHLVDHSSMGAPPVPEALKSAMGRAFGGAVILCGGYDRARAEQDLSSGRATLVAFGRPYLANPDLPRRLRLGAPLNPPDFSTLYTPGPKGYNDYPSLDEGGLTVE